MAAGNEDRIARVLADLRPEASVPARERPAQSLAQRMAYYATPGAGIAVVDGFTVDWAR